MNYNFNSSSSRKKVSLGGRSKTAETREQILKRTHAEREQRARNRVRERSALRIQAFWRSKSAVGKLKQQLRQHWVEAYGGCGEKLQGISTSEQAEAALRQLTFFSSATAKDDVVRLAAAGDLFFPAGAARVSPLMTAATRGSPGEAAKHLLQLMRLLHLCILSLSVHRRWILPETLSTQTPAELGNAGEALLHTIVRATDPQLWRQASPAGHERLAQLLHNLGRKGALHELSRILLAASRALEPSSGPTGGLAGARGGFASTSAPAAASTTNPSGPTVGAVAAFGARYVGVVPPADALVVTQLLCTPFLWSRCTGLKAFAGQLWLHAAKEMEGKADLSSLLPNDIANGRVGSAAALLGNLAEAASFAALDNNLQAHNGQESLMEAAMSFTAAASQLLGRLPMQTLFPAKYDEDDDFQESPSAQLSSGGTAAAWNEQEMSSSRVAQQIRALVSSSTVRGLMNLLLPQPTAQLRTPASRRARALCSMLSGPLATQALQHDTRLALAVNPELVPRLWNAYLKDAFRQGRWEAGEQDESSDPGWMLPLVLVSHCFSTFLATSAEASFYEQQRPLPFSELYREDGTGFLGLLKHALWQVLWVEQARGRPALRPAAQALRDSVSSAVGRLLGQLYDRNCRREFAPAEAFYAATLSADLFNAEVQQSLARGAFLEAKNTRVWQVLRHAPFLVPFQVRAAVFQNVVAAERDWKHHDRSMFQRPEPITIRRDQIFWDGFEQMNGLGEHLKERLQIQFVDVHGIPEAGVDGGGLFKDFMENLVKQGFDPQLGLFLATSDNRLYPNPNASLAMEQAVPAFEFLGKMVGKAMYEGIIVELPLAPFFLKQLLRRGSDVNDLPSLDAELYRNLMFLRDYEGDVEDLSLTFTLTRDVYGRNEEVELVPSGRDRPVTNANKTEYVLRTAHYRLNVETRQFTDAFRRGLEEVIEPEWVSMFNEEELQMLIRGRGTAGIDLDDLRGNVNYSGGYSEGHPTIQSFWQALASFTPQQQADWLKFVTACSRAPLLGFKHLSPQLCISKAGQESDPASQDRLPTSATCMNLLKLPPMKSPQQIAAKLLYAIENVAGFDLS